MEDGGPVPQEAVLVIRNEDIAQLLIQRYKEDCASRTGSLGRAIDVQMKPIVKLYQKWVKLVYDEYMRTNGVELQALLAEINKFSTYTYKLSLAPRKELKGWNGHGTKEGLSLELAARLVDEHNPEVQKYGYYAKERGLKQYFHLYGVHTVCRSHYATALDWTQGKRVVLKSKIKIEAPVERRKLTEKEQEENLRLGSLSKECKFPIPLKPKYFEISVTDEMRVVFNQIQDVLNAVLRAAKIYCENSARTNESTLKEFSERVRARITEHALQDLDIKEHMLSIYASAADREPIELLIDDDEDDLVEVEENETDEEPEDGLEEDELEDEEEDEDE